MKNLILIGQRAAGKTAAGERLAARLGVPFLDTDIEAARILGRPAAEVFAAGGEASFRAAEARVASSLARLEDTVVAAGGGMPVDDGNREALRAAGFVVWLDCAPEVLLSRRLAAGAAEERPALTGLPLEEEILLIRERRRPAYAAAAHARIDTSALGLEEVVRRLEEVWKENSRE